MKHTKKLVSSLAVLGFALSTLVACAKNESNNNGRITGNVSINGSSVSSSDTVNGQALAVNISGLSVLNNTMNNNNNFNYGYGTNYGQGTLNAVVNINGSTSNLQTYLVTPSTYQGAQPNYVGPYTVYSTAQCIDTACTNVAFVLWVSPQGATYNTQYKQIGLIQNLSNGQIRAAAEQVGYLSTSYGMSPLLPQAPQLIQTMQASMQ